MPGFTPINAHNPKAPALPEIEAAVLGQEKATKRRQPVSKKPSAQKNGDEAAAGATAPERISGNGRKRANHPSGEPDWEPKRRKSGSLKSSMPTTKTAVSATTTAVPDKTLNAKATSSSSTDAGLVSLTSMAKLNGFRYTRAQVAASGDTEPQSIQSSSISYVPETSMSIVSEAFSFECSQSFSDVRIC
jgi:3-oxoacyl-(acyl-carrier-protein) synthase